MSRKAPRASTSRTLLAYYCSITAQAVYNLWVAVAFMWGWAAAIVIIGLPLYEQRSIVRLVPWQRPRSATVPPQGRLGGFRQLDTPRGRGTGHCGHSDTASGDRRFHRLWPSRNRTTFLAVLTCNTKMNAPENKKSQVEMRKSSSL